jgi:L-fuconolactonase
MRRKPSPVTLRRSGGLVFDCWLYHMQLPELIALARAFPRATIVCDHVGHPLGAGGAERDAVMHAWRGHMADLAQCANVVVKLSGLGMASCGFGFDVRDVPPTSVALAAAWAPFVEHVVATFGVERCMFASNFPVDRVSCSYAALWNAFKRICDGARYTERQRDALFSGTARRVCTRGSCSFSFANGVREHVRLCSFVFVCSHTRRPPPS